MKEEDILRKIRSKEEFWKEEKPKEKFRIEREKVVKVFFLLFFIFLIFILFKLIRFKKEVSLREIYLNPTKYNQSKVKLKLNPILFLPTPNFTVLFGEANGFIALVIPAKNCENKVEVEGEVGIYFHTVQFLNPTLNCLDEKSSLTYETVSKFEVEKNPQKFRGKLIKVKEVKIEELKKEKFFYSFSINNVKSICLYLQKECEKLKEGKVYDILGFFSFVKQPIFRVLKLEEV